MEITVKRRTWLQGAMMPVNLKLNGKIVSSLHINQEKSIPVTEGTSQLEYTQPLDRSHQIQVRPGDTVILKETKLGMISNLFFFLTVIYYIAMGQEIFQNGFLNNFSAVSVIALILLTMVVILGIITLFFNQYKFVIENNSSEE